MRDYTVYCQEGNRIDTEDGVKVRVVLCNKVAKLYRLPGSPHDVSLCGEHVRRYHDAVEVV